MSERPPGSARRDRRPTSTSNFGSGRRESHDATAFYDRFTPPVVSTDSDVTPARSVDRIFHGDSRDMDAVATGSVALVVTSPPYFAGKQYEESLGVDGVPATYFEYLELLRDVFAECARVLEPGGRIAVNVANLGRRPYRSLSGDVTAILESLGLLLRGEVIWWKGRAAGGSCAWGTFQSPANPVLRDVTERVVIASKGRFDRAQSRAERDAGGLPSTVTVSREEFMEATTDLWELAPESATRVGHPAPFPVELPQRLIQLYTYQGDVVLDPFMGSGSTAVAAVRTGRHYIGYDTDDAYITTAEGRVHDERRRMADDVVPPELRVEVGADVDDDPVTEAVRDGRQAKDVARVLLQQCGFVDVRDDVKPRGLGIVLGLVATDATGSEWAFDVSGSFTTGTSGLRRSDTLWRTLATAGVYHASTDPRPLVALTTQAPKAGTAGFYSLRTMTGAGKPIVDVVEMLDPDAQARLRAYAGS